MCQHFQNGRIRLNPDFSFIPLEKISVRDDQAIRCSFYQRLISSLLVTALTGKVLRIKEKVILEYSRSTRCRKKQKPNSYYSISAIPLTRTVLHNSYQQYTILASARSACINNAHNSVATTTPMLLYDLISNIKGTYYILIPILILHSIRKNGQ